ncbi:hypothetical protein [uncultured Erythrobacter sp.]|uniref:hypothetical protein n=1 Tax=uncultured Erythrobacter sp. TaxID=263913 RepID=UPI0026100AA5|nr:hypothetical protein [uncultured Erythrobacter sp.]
MNGSALAILAIVPLVTGPLPSEAEDTLTMTLCDGGSITISLGDEDEMPASDCHQKACHAGNCRKQFDPKQRQEVA